VSGYESHRGQLSNHPFVNAGLERKIELLQCFSVRQVCEFGTYLHIPFLAFCYLCIKEHVEKGQIGGLSMTCRFQMSIQEESCLLKPKFLET